ncbi:putative translation machinery-associated protein [Septoria linicola]|nr:putative translation machinery-associated protein [Septoria linicola]
MPRPLPPWLELIPAANTDAATTDTTLTTTAPSPTNPTPSSEPSQTDNLLPWDTMSSTSTPISPGMFSLAIKDLPVDTLYAKAAELLNSMQHLRYSNAQMQQFADEGDEVCKEAIAENDVVMERMLERVELCRVEVERRGMRWTGHVQEAGGEEGKINGVVEVNGNRGSGAAETRPSGRLTDEELRRQLEAQMGDDEEDDGVHL